MSSMTFLLEGASGLTKHDLDSGRSIDGDVGIAVLENCSPRCLANDLDDVVS